MNSTTFAGARMTTPRARRAGARLLALALLSALQFVAAADRVGAETVLITQGDAAPHGLVRAWFAQLPVNAARSRITTYHLYFDRLYSVSDSGLVTALDAETGSELWTRQVGRPDFHAFGPTANEKYLGVVSGSKLYMLDRHTGRLIWSRVLGSAPSSGPALSEKYAYIALVTGRIEGYLLDDPRAQPWYYQSKGRTHLRPTTTGTVVSWPTTEGILYVSNAEDPGVRFRLETGEDIITSPAEQDPFLYIASLDGYLYCMDENTGQQQWRYSTGYPIASSPAIVGKHAYVASLEPVLHAMDSISGQPLWTAPGVSHFAAEGKQRVYASDRYGNLLILDSKTGRPVGRVNVAEGQYTLVNDQTDRLFVVSELGLVQCLREAGADQPTMHRKPNATEPAEGEPDAGPASTPAADSEQPVRPAEPAVGEVGEPGVEEPEDQAAEAPQRAVDEPPDFESAPFGEDF